MSQPIANAPIATAASGFARRTILLVEDEPFVREATRSILENAGFSVLPAANALEAVEAYEHSNRPVDLVMTDLVLPGRSGQQLGDDLRQRSGHVKVLVTSGYAEAECENENPAAETYFLAKPYSRRGLVKKIDTILSTDSLHCSNSRAS